MDCPSITSTTTSSSDIISKEEDEYSELTSPASVAKRARPSYIIERDCHVFGGCMDEDALDEFFISSGAIYQSWPYVYEPGFQLVPLVEYVNYPLWRSAAEINYYEQTNAHKSDYESQLPSYSINNYEINMMHVLDSGSKKQKKRRRHKKTAAKKNCHSDVGNDKNRFHN